MADSGAGRQPPGVGRAATASPAPITPLDRVIAAAEEQVQYTTRYDPAYTVLDYPMGDVPRDRGVCSDVIIRAFRAGGVDLQEEVHEDMKRAFQAYPNLWGLRGPDRNIDHRRVPNLMTFFRRKGKTRPITLNPREFAPGDVVAWELGNGRLHTGIISRVRADSDSRFKIVHNIGAGARLEDVLFAWKVIGHYRWFD